MKIDQILLLTGCIGAVKASRVTVNAPFLSFCDFKQLETSEFLAKLGKNYLINYLRGEQWQSLSDNQLKLLNLALKYRLYAPQIAIYQSLFPIDAPTKCSTFVAIGTEYHCEVEGLKRALKSVQQTNLSSQSYGHRLIGSTNASTSSIILYSKIGSPTFSQLHELVTEMIQGKGINYIYRPIVENSCQDKEASQVAGFGMQLELKQYFREELQFEGLDLTPPFGIQNWSPLGLKALQMILTADDSLLAFSQVSENFPWLAHHLHELEVSPEIANKAEFMGQHGLALSDAMISLNGMPIDTKHMEVAGLLDFIIAYRHLVETYLAPLSDDPKVGDKLAMEIMDGIFAIPALRFDVRHPAVVYLNDLEHDSEYSSWSKEYNSIMQPPTTPYFPLARNAVVLVMAINLDKPSPHLAQVLVQLFQEQAAIRVGVVLDGKNTDKAAFLYGVLFQYGRNMFLVMLKLLMEQSDTPLEEHLSKVLAKANIQTTVSVVELQNMGTAAANATYQFVTQFGIDQETITFINGKILSYTPDSEFPRKVNKAYQTEIYNLQLAILQKAVSDSTDYYNHILSDVKVAKSRHADVFSPKTASSFVNISPLAASSKHWIYSGDSTDNCAYSVLAVVDTNRHDDMVILAVWLKMMGETSRKVRLQISPQGEEKSYVERVIKDLRDKKSSFNEGAKLIESLKISKQSKIGYILPFEDDFNDRDTVLKGLEQGPMFIVNGHIYGPLRRPLSSTDVNAMLLYEWHQRTERLQLLRIANDLEKNPAALSSMTMFEGLLQQLLRGRFAYLFPGGKASDFPLAKLNHVKINHDEDYPRALQITAVLNPFTMEGAKVSAILLELQDFMEITLIPKIALQYGQIPSPYLYRFRGFQGNLSPLLPRTTFSIMVHSPPAWKLIEASDNVDLDNMVADNEHNPDIILNLPSLIAEVDVTSPDNDTKRWGNSYTLTNSKLQASATSITGRGYTQFQILPGIYQMASNVDGQSPFAQVIVDSIVINRSKVRATNPFEQAIHIDKSDQVDIFSIPGNLVEERMLTVLIASAVRQSKKPLRFWILDNFLSSTGQRTLSVLARRHHFTLNYVHMKWPTWLLTPRDRQQRLAAYKLLFLDALPFGAVQRLIHLDARQIARGNIAELKGAVLGYAAYGMIPTCEGNPLISVLPRSQFWKYDAEWKERLRGKQFYGTNVIVIDLPTFRTRNLGDRIRTEYQSIVRNTPSYLPLDQILVNRLHTVSATAKAGDATAVPIHPVVDYWSWCETLCDNKRKAFSRMIYFCETPHRPGDPIETIQKIAPEWRMYEELIRRTLGEEMRELQKLKEKVEMMRNDDDILAILADDEGDVGGGGVAVAVAVEGKNRIRQEL